MIKRIFCVQIWRDDRWQTIYLSSFSGDAQEAYEDTLDLTDAKVRLVRFIVDGADFVATHARDFLVVEAATERV